MAEPESSVEQRAARRRDDRRQQIIEVAKEIFAERGYHATSISEIIKRAGIARGTFYLYFEHKHKVFESILTEALGELIARIQIIHTGPEAASPRQQVAQNLNRVLTFLCGDRPLSQLLLKSGLTPDAESAERIERFFDRIISLLQASLEHGIARGLVRPCNTELVATALLGAIRGVIARQIEKDDPLDVALVVEELLAFSWRGVTVPEVWG